MPIPPLPGGPTPPYNNPPIQPQFYQPRRFVISDITLGTTTIVQTTENMDYVIGQLVKIMIPPLYAAFQLNNSEGYVISLPSPNEVEIDMNSSGSNAFISNPITASITGATQANPCVLTCSSHFSPGQYISISDVGGMLELNGQTFLIIQANATTVTIDVDASGYAAYTSGGTATLLNYLTTQPQIIAIGDINSGQVNANGRRNQKTYIPGSFINVSPN